MTAYFIFRITDERYYTLFLRFCQGIFSDGGNFFVPACFRPDEAAIAGKADRIGGRRSGVFFGLRRLR